MSTVDLGFSAWNLHTLEMRVTAAPLHDGEPSFHVVGLVMTCYDSRDWEKVDWATFDLVASAFPYLNKVTFVFGEKGKEADIIKRTIAQLVQLSQKKTFAIVYEKRSEIYDPY